MLALEFCILTTARSGEVLGARWSEIDLKNKIRTVPANRMKAGRELYVPLTMSDSLPHYPDMQTISEPVGT